MNVLSFGDDAEEDEEDQDDKVVGFRSALETRRHEEMLEAGSNGVHDGHIATLQAQVPAQVLKLSADQQPEPE